MAKTTNDNDWDQWFGARLEAIESVLGPAEKIVGHASIPFDVGSDDGGAADIINFKHHVKGVVSVTSELIGRDDQIQNDLGNYELMICHRDEDEWGAEIISHLAYYTLRVRVNPGETMDIGEAAPEGSTIAALLFVKYATFEVKQRKAGLLLCIGITDDELRACRKDNREIVEKSLKAAKVYPFTDLYRSSVLEG